MSFQPVIPATGYAGWRFLSRTIDSQKAAFVKTPAVARDTAYFRDKIGQVRSADDLVKDRQLLSVALGAFGLDDDLGNKAFIRKVLADGTLRPEALANRLADKRYAALALSFGFGDLGARTGLSGFAKEIITKFEARQFERAVGGVNESMRLALAVRDGLADVTAQSANPRAQWFAVMGNPPLRKVFEGALGFSAAFGRINIDQQLTQFQSRLRSNFGTDKIADLASPVAQERLIRLYLTRTEAGTGTSAASVALSLLGGAR